MPWSVSTETQVAPEGEGRHIARLVRDADGPGDLPKLVPKLSVPAELAVSDHPQGH
jgi:hypothetical protein